MSAANIPDLSAGFIHMDGTKMHMNPPPAWFARNICRFFITNCGQIVRPSLCLSAAAFVGTLIAPPQLNGGFPIITSALHAFPFHEV
jgi:hypothetical protein